MNRSIILFKTKWNVSFEGYSKIPPREIPTQKIATWNI